MRRTLNEKLNSSKRLSAADMADGKRPSREESDVYGDRR